MYDLNAGRLRNRVTFMEYTDSVDEYGRTVQTLKEFKTVWAEVKPQRGLSYLDQYRERNKLLTKITCRFFEGCTEDLVVRLNGALYEVNAVIDVENTHHVLEVMIQERVNEDKLVE